ncbi:MAG: hypothetical protein AAF441_09795 [Pseudomonadota bacterium]
MKGARSISGEEIWELGKSDPLKASGKRLFYRMIGNSRRVTKLSLSVEAIYREEVEAVPLFHSCTLKLAERATGRALPDQVSEAILDLTREDDSFSLVLPATEEFAFGYIFSTYRRDPRDPGGRSLTLTVLSPHLARQMESARDVHTAVFS